MEFDSCNLFRENRFLGHINLVGVAKNVSLLEAYHEHGDIEGTEINGHN